MVDERGGVLGLRQLLVHFVHVVLDPRHHDLQPVDLLEGGLHGRVLLLQIGKVLFEANPAVVLLDGELKFWFI
jgi:hypothetical protein